MKRSALAAAAAVAAALLLGGCGSSADRIHFGLVTGPEGVAGEKLSAVSSGMETASVQRNFRTQSYTAADAEDAAYETVFEQAADDGVEYVLCVGEEMEIPLYAAQGKHTKSRYILFDGEPRKSAEAGSSVRKNTMCISFDKASMGFVAGCAAVREGKRNIVFMTGHDNDPDTAQYLAGFVNGVGYESSTLGIGSDAVSVGIEYTGLAALSPMRMTDAKNLVEGGTELIVTDIPEILTSLELGSGDSARLASVGFDASEDSTVVYSVTADYEKITSWLLNRLEDHKGFEGGTVLHAGAAESGIRFASTYYNLSVFTTTDLDNILAAMADGTAVVYDTASAATAGVKLEGLTELGAAVRTSLVEPTAPDGSAGLTGSASRTDSEAGEASEA